MITILLFLLLFLSLFMPGGFSLLLSLLFAVLVFQSRSF